VNAALAGLNALESSTTYPLLLAFFQKRASREIADDEVARAIQMLRGFILRRFVCNGSSSYGKSCGVLGIDGVAKEFTFSDTLSRIVKAPWMVVP
jgi:hypothetical protein